MHRLSNLCTRIHLALEGLHHRVVVRVADASGQTTAEYALVILGAAAIGTLLIAWATKSHAVGKLFDEVVGKILP
ncbi:MAG: DUF4244 domain-containing protein [Actinobacteria bacterium]|nr:DUF4244 domain-containing protein [Actinomycetota bacterium]